MSSYHDSFGAASNPVDDPEGIQAERDAEADEMAAHPERCTVLTAEERAGLSANGPRKGSYWLLDSPGATAADAAREWLSRVRKVDGEGKQMSNWNLPPGVSTNDLPGNRPNDDLEWQHEGHSCDPDPDCQMCRANWDYYGEAERIAEGRSNLMPTAAHIKACFARVEELSNEVELLKLMVSGLRRA